MRFGSDGDGGWSCLLQGSSCAPLAQGDQSSGDELEN